MPAKLFRAQLAAKAPIQNGLSDRMYPSISILDLPAEVRNEIYAEQLLFEGPLLIGGSGVAWLYRRYMGPNPSLVNIGTYST